MPSVPQVTALRHRRRARAQRNPGGRAGLLVSLLLSLLFALSAIGLSAMYVRLALDLPEPSALPELADYPDGILLQPTRLYDQTGEHFLLTLQNPAAEDKRYLPVNLVGEDGGALPVSLLGAVTAWLDPGFWDHPGVRLPLSAAQPGTAEKHTLAQRLVTGLILWDEQPGLRRDLRAGILALQVTARYGREKILEWYLNTASFGSLAYGADAAARVYFGKPAEALSLAEAALLAGVAGDPSQNPFDAPAQAIALQKQVLQAMLDQDLITRSQFESAFQAVLRFQPASSLDEGLAPAFSGLVLSQIERDIPRQRLERGGLRIITTLDFDLQTQVQCASAVLLQRLQNSTQTETAGCEAARLLPPIAGNRPADSPGIPDPGAEVVILEATSGRILALAGGSPSPAPGSDLFARSFSQSPLPPRPAGTILTPFVYLAAFTQGFSPASLVWDLPPGEGLGISLENVGEAYHGPVRLRSAFANDYVSPALHILNQAGAENVHRIAGQLGLEGLSVQNLLQNSHADLLQLTRAYGVFANQGLLAGRLLANPGSAAEGGRLEMMAVRQVEDTSGRVWMAWESVQTQPVISPELAYLVTDVLSDRSARWESLGNPNPLEVSRTAAAKIGRSFAQDGAWTVGYTPQLTVGVWVGSQAGAQSPLPSPGAAGRFLDSAASLWHALMEIGARELPAQDWQQPFGIITETVCDPSGMLPSEDCPVTVDEIFLSGTEPTHVDTLYHKVQVNQETGQLATVFTRPDLVEERIFMNLPVDARAWAEETGFPTPPEAIDAISAEISISPEAHLTAPAMFATVGGKVRLEGAVQSDNLDFYRVQIGQGLNPQEWIQVGEDSSEPVEGGLLAEWDTAGYEGLYTIQLLMVRQDHTAERAFVLVTVDNQAPEIEILYPGSQAPVPLHPNRRTLTVRVEAQDDLSLREVQIFVDGELKASLIQPPYTVTVAARPGEHSLEVSAVDLAGNSSEVQAGFEVK
jgi:membrane peptidoglycan carboxypeptidase